MPRWPIDPGVKVRLEMRESPWDRSKLFLSIICSYLVVIVCVQIFIIYNLKVEIRDFRKQYNSESECAPYVTERCCEPQDTFVKNSNNVSMHEIWKRHARSYGSCPPGCVRRKRRRLGFTSSRGEETLPVSSHRSSRLGTPGMSAAAGAPGQPGGMGLAGTPGRMGAAGAPGRMGAAGAPGRMGAAGAPGRMGEAGAPGLQGPPGAGGIRGMPGAQGAPGEAGDTGETSPYDDQGYRSPRLKSRGDQGNPPEDPQAYSGVVPKKTDAQILKELRLLDHPECKDEVNHRALMQDLKNKGKVSFMILVDLEDSIYCIVHA